MIEQLPVGTFCAIIRRDAIDDAKPDFVTCERDGELIGQDVILRLEIGRLQGEDTGEGGRG